jgi:UDP-N-acetyl-D-mannosaminuronic acid dehydrogenase
MSTVCVVGLGYIGLPVAAMLAARGHQVVGCDIDAATVASINEGRARFFEPELDMLLGAAVQTGRLKAQGVPVAAEYYVIAVPTPLGPGNTPELRSVEAAIQSIAPFVQAGSTVIIESTIPVGATEDSAAALGKLRPDLRVPRFGGEPEEADMFVAHCPERILPGQMVRELVSNDRIVGGMTEACAEKAAALYSSFVDARCLITDCRTAEFVKLTENAYRDVNIAFANELSLISDKLGLDVWKAIELANRHPRVNILQPSAGVGGHCIAVDPWFLVHSAPEQTPLIRTAREVNLAKTEYVIDRIALRADRFKNPVVACYGITYKANVEDLRESPSLHIVQELARRGTMQVLVCDPFFKEKPPGLRNFANVEMTSADDARERADVVAFLVGHNQFRKFEIERFLDKIIVDVIGLSRTARARSVTS